MHSSQYGVRRGGDNGRVTTSEGSAAWWLAVGLVGAMVTATAARYRVQNAAELLSIGDASVAPTDVLSAVSIVASIVVLRRWRIQIRSWPITRGLTLYAVGVAPAVVATLIAGHASEVAWGLRLTHFAVLYGIAIPASVWLLWQPQSRMGLLVRVANIGTIVAVSSLALHFLGAYSVPGFESAEFGTYSGRIARVAIINDSVLPLQGVFAMAGLIAGGTRWDRWAGAFAAAGVGAAVLISPGRAAALVLGIGLIAILFLVTAQRRVRVVRAMVLGGALLVVAVGIATWAGSYTGISLERSVARLASVEQAVSLPNQQTRIRGWAAGMELASRHPVLGNGIGMQYEDLHTDYATDSFYTVPSMYIDTAARAGFVGLGALLGLLLSPIVFTNVGPRETLARIMSSRYGVYCAVGLAAFLIRGVNDQIFFDGQSAILVGVILAYLSVTVRRPASDIELL